MAEKFPTPQERAMAWLLEAQEIRRHEQAGDRAVRLPTRLAGRLYAMSLKRLKRKCEKYAKRERKAIEYVATLKEES